MSADLSLKVLHASLQLDNLHIEGGLLAPEGSDLLLETCVLLFLPCEVTLDVLLHLEQLVCQGFAHILGLECELAL